ncbi:MAG: LysR family transcriptional regulator [Pseudomonadota bacterium]
MVVHSQATSNPDLDWNLVRTFVAVADSGSLAAAARVLRLAHPTVSRHIQQLEAALGLTLFNRTKQGLTLNREGRALASQARAMREQAVAFERLSDGVRAAPLPRIRITVAELLMETVPALLLPSLAAGPGAGVPVEFLVANEQLNLLERQADLAIRHVRPQQQELICRRVGEVPMLACASKTYLERFGEPTPDNLDGHRFIDGVEESRFQQGAAGVGVFIPDAGIVFRSESILAQRAAMLAGWGIAALPLPMLDELPDAVPVMDGGVAVAIDVWLVARPELRNTLQLKAVYDHVGDALQAHLAHDLPRLPKFEPPLRATRNASPPVAAAGSA